MNSDTIYQASQKAISLKDIQLSFIYGGDLLDVSMDTQKTLELNIYRMIAISGIEDKALQFTLTGKALGGTYSKTGDERSNLITCYTRADVSIQITGLVEEDQSNSFTKKSETLDSAPSDCAQDPAELLTEEWFKEPLQELSTYLANF